MRDGTVRPPKDGLRATCPAFKARAEQFGVYYLLCKGQGLKFEERQDRDGYYKTFCCGDRIMQQVCATRKS